MRNCPGCSPVLRNQLLDRIKEFFADDTVWFMTLTMQATDNSDIMKHWHELQHHALNYYYKGLRGFWTVELTKRGKAHLHALITQSIDTAWLQRAWKQITNSSYIARCEPTQDIKNPAGYMLKYITKQHNNDHLFKKGTRRYGFFGAPSPKIKLLGFEDDDPGEFILDRHFNQSSKHWPAYYQELQLAGGPAFISWFNRETLNDFDKVRERNYGYHDN